MSDTLITALIAGLVGLLTGAIGSLVAPWAQWGVEKQRKKLERKIALVEHWRTVLASPNFNRRYMRGDPTYGVLLPLLSDDAKEIIERPSNHIRILMANDNQTPDPDRTTLLHEVARIEREWNLL